MPHSLLNTLQKTKRCVEVMLSDVVYGAVDVVIELRKRLDS